MPIETPRFRKWQLAEQAAQAAERAVGDRLRGMTVDASDDLRDEMAFVGEMRRHVHRLFVDALEELDDVSSTLHRRAVLAMRTGVDRQAPRD